MCYNNCAVIYIFKDVCWLQLKMHHFDCACNWITISEQIPTNWVLFNDLQTFPGVYDTAAGFPPRISSRKWRTVDLRVEPHSPVSGCFFVVTHTDLCNHSTVAVGLVKSDAVRLRCVGFSRTASERENMLNMIAVWGLGDRDFFDLIIPLLLFLSSPGKENALRVHLANNQLTKGFLP